MAVFTPAVLPSDIILAICDLLPVRDRINLSVLDPDWDSFLMNTPAAWRNLDFGLFGIASAEKKEKYDYTSIMTWLNSKSDHSIVKLTVLRPFFACNWSLVEPDTFQHLRELDCQSFANYQRFDSVLQSFHDLGKRLPVLHTLSIAGLFGADMALMLLESCPMLINARFGLGKMTRETPTYGATASPHLKRLEFFLNYARSETRKHLTFRFGHWLRNLATAREYDFPRGFLRDTLSLEELHIQHAHWRVEDDFTHMPNLRAIVMPRSEGLDKLHIPPSIEELDINVDTFTSSTSISPTPNLRRLAIHVSPNIFIDLVNSAGLDGVYGLALLGSAKKPNLSEVAIFYDVAPPSTHQASLDGIILMALGHRGAWSNVTKLTYRSLVDSWNQDLSPMLSNVFPNIEVLDLNHRWVNIGAQAFILLVSGFGNLKVLDIGIAAGVPDEILEWAASKGVLVK